MADMERKNKASMLRRARKSDINSKSRSMKRALEKEVEKPKGKSPFKLRKAKEEMKHIDIFLNRGKK